MKSKTFGLLTAAVMVLLLAVPVSALPDPNPALVVDDASRAERAPDAPSSAPDVYIILLEGDSLSSYQGGIPGIEATNPAARGQARLDAHSPASVAYLDYLAAQHAQFITTMEQTLDRPVDVLHRYDAVLNGLAVRLSVREAKVVAGLPGVRRVERDFLRQLETDVGPAWIGAEGIWDGSATGEMSKGEGLIIGVIDTGINGDHPSFADPGPSDGYGYTNPLPAYLGDCAPPTPTYTCNDKLIGVYDFTTANDPEDFDGHGSHTASTAAGNVLTDVAIDFPTIVITRSISGVAPHAHLITYRACGPGGCPNSATNAAINQAVLDGVDAINYSIGGGASNPWTDTNSLAYLDARAAGVFVATSAGNEGPGAATVGSPANSPWLLSVGNATHNRTFTNTISFSGGPTALGPFDGTSATSGYGPQAIVHAGDYGDPLCGTAFAPGTWSGEIVVCDRGSYALVDKVSNAANGGAGAVVIANADFNGLGTAAIPHVLPSIHLNYADAEALRTWLASGSGHMATITDAVVAVNDVYGDRMATGSSRGPNGPVLDVIKPDVIAPGSDILAAYKTPEEYNMISGTSMASPHTAGASLLLRSLYPNWTPAMIQSALVSTAVDDVAVKEDWTTPADPFDMGGGRVYASNAAQAGFVLDETIANYQAANPAMGGDPSALNLATLAQDACAGTCTWTRVLSSTQDTTVSWTATVAAPAGLILTVEPAAFDLAAYATQRITVTADANALPLGDWAFGQVILTPAAGSVAEAHLPVAVVPEAEPPAISVDPERFDTAQLTNSIETYPLLVGNSGDSPLEWEIYEDAGTGKASTLADWSDNFDSYPTDTQLQDVGGWKGWGNDPAAAGYTRDEQARSTPNSIEIVNLTDAVHEYSGYTSGLWHYTAWQYIPAGSTGESYFILLNQYDDAGVNNNWSTQVNFNSNLNMVLAEGEAAGAQLPLVREQWMEIRVEIDLVNDIQKFYYGGDLLYESSWTDGMSGGGILNIAAVDLWGNGASAVYYDDICLTSALPEICQLPSEIPWVSVSPISGTTPAGDTSTAGVTFDTNGLDLGTAYNGTLCVTSNDPETPLVIVPLTLTVVSCVEVAGATISGPDILVVGEPGTFTVTVDPPNATEPLTIEWNNGMTGTEAVYSSPEPGSITIVVTATNCAGTVVTDSLLVPVFCVGVTTATITGPEMLMVGQEGSYEVTLTPPNATEPVEIEWSDGMTGTTAVYSWDAPGDYTIVVTATNCGETVVTSTFDVTVDSYHIYLPIVLKND